MELVIIGGNTYLQRSVARACSSAGHRAYVVASDPAETADIVSAQLEPNVNIVSNSPELSDVATRCDAAVVLDRSLTAGARDVDADPTDRQQALQFVESARVRRLIFVSSPARDPEKEQPDALDAIRRASPEWLVLRCASVYGIAEDPVTLFLIMMRSAPAVPMLSDAYVMQPLWHEDLARSIATALDLPAADLNRTLDLTGPERMTLAELYSRIAALTGRQPLRVPLPDFLASYGLPSGLAAESATAASVSAESNALRTVFGVTPTRIDDGLRRLILELPEVTPAEGEGSIQLKRFGALIRNAKYDAAGLLRQFRARFADVMPVGVGVEPVVPTKELNEGAVLTMALPGRGHVQVRVEDVGTHHVVLGTLRGHVVAGIVRFSTRDAADGVRFEVMTCNSAANGADWISFTLGSARLQDANWRRVVQNVIDLSGGHSDDGVQHDARTLEEEEAASAQRWMTKVISRQQAENAAGPYERS